MSPRFPLTWMLESPLILVPCSLDRSFVRLLRWFGLWQFADPVEFLRAVQVTRREHKALRDASRATGIEVGRRGGGGLAAHAVKEK